MPLRLLLIQSPRTGSVCSEITRVIIAHDGRHPWAVPLHQVREAHTDPSLGAALAPDQPENTGDLQLRERPEGRGSWPWEEKACRRRVSILSPLPETDTTQQSSRIPWQGDCAKTQHQHVPDCGRSSGLRGWYGNARVRGQRTGFPPSCPATSPENMPQPASSEQAAV